MGSLSRPARLGLLALVLTTVLWGISFALVGDVVAGRGAGLVFVFLALRFSLASVAFLPVARPILRACRGLGARPWLDALLVGALLFVGYALQTLGLVHTSPGRSAFITMFSVVLVPFLAALEHRRRPSPLHLGSGLGVLVGLAFVMSPGGRFQPNLGDLLTFGCALAFALHIVALERVTRRSPAWPIAFGQIAAVALLALCTLPWLTVDWPASWPGLWLAVGVTGVVSTTLALGLMVWGQARVPAESAAMVFALEPVWAALFEVAYLGAGLGPLQWVAGAWVVGAVILGARAPVPSGGHGPIPSPGR